jgi:hypothetical protein
MSSYLKALLKPDPFAGTAREGSLKRLLTVQFFLFGLGHGAQGKLAFLMGLNNQSQISNIFGGACGISVKTAEALHKSTGIPPEWLLWGAEGRLSPDWQRRLKAAERHLSVEVARRYPTLPNSKLRILGGQSIHRS